MDNGCTSLAVNKVIVLTCVDDGQNIVGNGCTSLAVNKVIVLTCVDDGQKIVGQWMYFTSCK